MTLDRTSHRFSRKGQSHWVEVTDLQADQSVGYVLVFDTISDGCLVRIHSRCLYGESLGFDDCDCGQQLDRSLDLIQAAGSGILIYLEQEGRGRGLIGKALGYQESERSGLDTFASYRALGYRPDERDYSHAAEVLTTLELTAVQLLTNNPAKLTAVKKSGIRVTVVPLPSDPRTERARAYLDAKRRHHHWIPTADPPWAIDLGGTGRTDAPPGT